MKHLLKEATDCKAALNSQLKQSEERATQLKQDTTLKRALEQREEDEVDNVDKYQKAKIESRDRESQLHDEKHTQRRTRGQVRSEDKVKMQNIMSGTQIPSRRWSSSMR